MQKCKVCKKKINSAFITLEDGICSVCVKKIALVDEENKIKARVLKEESERKARELKEESERIEKEKEKEIQKNFELKRKEKNANNKKSNVSFNKLNQSNLSEKTKKYNPPQIIEILKNIGWFLLALSSFVGFIKIVSANDSNFGLVFGFALIISGIIECALFHGFAAIIQELSEIKENTSSD